MLKFPIALIALASLTACASLEPEPCTSEWVEWKTEKVLTGFARSNYGEIKRLKDFSQSLETGKLGALTALKMPGMIADFKELARSFEARVLPELNAAAAQCGNPEKLIPAFTAFLRKEGVGDEVLAWVDLIAALASET